ncbi:DUF3293 domain-containing protein [Nitrosomonas ureae]|uniref:DUF3293 domain-containing protein n=1 Tax=Nitrosomonas ureae TaxID=44577 RepID=A0A1H5RLL4_9PROT|nr:DUF3293 domain-containing protein [Nitrosomonas ureae]SEF39235.1 Protein of unknown function [Nitrosomonas ureae]
MVLSVITSNLIASYRRTHYRVGAGCNSIFLCIDQYSESLAKFLAASKQSCAAIVSAYNPYSQLASNEENLEAHEQLRNLLQHRPYPIIESLNIDPTGQWPPEESLFVPGLDLNTGRSIGQQFNQNAIAWIDNEAIPRLILLR